MITVTTDDQTELNPRGVAQALANPGDELSTGVMLHGGRAVWSGLGLWLALHDERFCSLSAEQPTTAMPSIAAEFQWNVGLMADDSLALLTPSSEPVDTGQVALGVRLYGKDGSLAAALVDHVHAWESAGRPAEDSLQINVYPLQAVAMEPSGTSVVAKRWHRFVIMWS